MEMAISSGDQNQVGDVTTSAENQEWQELMIDDTKEIDGDELHDETDSVERVTRAFSSSVDIKAKEPRTIVARISTTSVDREGDVVLPSGLKLADYKKNPVVLLNHDNGSLPIGRALSVKRTSDAVIAKVQFAERPPEHPITAEWVPDTILSLFKQKILRAFSVGFIPTDMRDANDKDRKRYGDNARRIITQWDLMEFSVVPVPANQDALAVEVAKSSTWLTSAWHLKAERPRLVLDRRSRFKVCDSTQDDS
tara:strand:+ start:417 stop:1172 length:756 start_codon:yes stop_codon:yes gene_type:complete